MTGAAACLSIRLRLVGAALMLAVWLQWRAEARVARLLARQAGLLARLERRP